MTAPYWSNGVATLYQADARAIPTAGRNPGALLCDESPVFWIARLQFVGVGPGER